MKNREKPTQKDLLRILNRLQTLIGFARGQHENDKNPMGFEQGQNALAEAHNLCIDALGFFPPLSKSDMFMSLNGWNLVEELKGISDE